MNCDGCKYRFSEKKRSYVSEDERDEDEPEYHEYTIHKCRRYPPVRITEPRPAAGHFITSWQFPPANHRCGEYFKGYEK